MATTPVKSLPTEFGLTEGRETPRVIIIGAGLVGLSTAWFLQEYGVEVVVLERSGVAAGSSWGNAGWLTPGLSAPLNEPSVLKFGVESLVNPDSPMYVQPRMDPKLAQFMMGFAARCTAGQWTKALKQYVPINLMALDAFDKLAAGGVKEETKDTDFIAAWVNPEHGDAVVNELTLFADAGLDVGFRELSTADFASEAPLLASQIQRALHITKQRFIEPGKYTESVAESVEARGGQLRIGTNARNIHHGPKGVTVELEAGEPVSGDAVVIATGAWLPTLANRYGVKKIVQSGRGYSFSVAVTEPSLTPVPTPYYFPRERVACTPIGERFRIAGTMEFDHVDAPLRGSRVDALEKSAKPLMKHLNFMDKRDEWVGGRPVCVDSKPLIGATRVPRVFVNGGHGMWGISLGPASGELLAKQIVEGKVPAQLRPFNPLR